MTDEAINEKHYFGACPVQGCAEKTDHYPFANVSRDHWFYCEEHETSWCAGSNLFGGWRDESQEIWDATSDMLDRYRQVEPRTTWRDERHEEFKRAKKRQRALKNVLLSSFTGEDGAALVMMMQDHPKKERINFYKELFNAVRNAKRAMAVLQMEFGDIEPGGSHAMTFFDQEQTK